MRKSSEKILLIILLLFIVLSSVKITHASEISSPKSVKKFMGKQGLTQKRVKYYCLADTTVSRKEPFTSYGSKTYISAGYYKDTGGSTYYTYRAFLKFPLPQGLSSDDIVKASLRIILYAKKTFFEKGTTQKEFRIYRIASPWDENTTWNSSPSIALDPTFYGGFVVKSTYSDKRACVAYITNLVKKWLDGTYPNYGLAILGTKSDEHALVSWYSREGPEKLRPSLTIVYKYGPEIEIIPSTINGYLGTVINVTVKVYSRGGFSGTVTFTLISPPSGYTYSFTQPSLSISPSDSPKTTVLRISISKSANTGTKDIWIEARSGTYYDQKPLKLTVFTKGFFLTVTPPTIALSRGGSATVLLKVTKAGDYNEKVSFSTVSAPSGVTVSYDPSSLTPTGTSTILIKVSSKTPLGTYTIKIKARGADGHTRYTTIQLTVKESPFNYTLSVSSDTLVIDKGESGSVIVSVNVVSGAPRQVQLSAEGLPKGAYTFSLQKLTPPATSVFTINTKSLSEGVYTVVIKATCGSLVKKATLVVKVIIKTDFSLAISPSSLEIEQGGSGSTTVQVVLTKGSSKQVELSAENVPKGVVCQFSPVKLNPTASSKLTVTVGSDVPKGTYNITVVAKCENGLTKTATLVLKVKEKSKCIIATVTYGSEVADEVQILRNFRDNIVLSTYAGSCFYIAFNAFYYSWSPYVAYWIQANPWIKPLFKALIYPLIGILLFSTYLVSPLVEFNAELAVYTAGTIASILIGLVYYSPIVYFVSRKRPRYFSKRNAMKIGLTALSILAVCILAQLAGLSIVLTLATSAYVLAIIALAAYSTPIVIDSIVKRRHNIK